MEFRILGPLEVEERGDRLAITAPREQTLLAMLILDANRVVPVGRLIDAIWHEAPPETARRQVHICVSLLRRTLRTAGGRGVILTRAPGYLLDVPSDTIDATEFEAMVDAGRSAAEVGRTLEAIGQYRSALSLWRGLVAAGIESQWVRIAATRLEEQRLVAWEECLALEIEVGNHATVIGEIAALAKEHPLREKIRALQMVALYRAGRQVDALSVFRELYQSFGDELGIEPSDELKKLELAILNNHASLSAPPTDSGVRVKETPGNDGVLPRQLPADIIGFTGREDIIAAVRKLLCPDDGGGYPAIGPVLLTGMSGVGKTALAVHVGHLLEQQFPDGQLFIQLSDDAGQPVPVDRALGQLLRAVGVVPHRVPAEPSELAQMYRSMLASKKVLVVLDDAVSAEQVMELLPGGRTCGVLVTSRRPAIHLVGAHAFDVGVLPPAAAAELLARMVPDAQLKNVEKADLAELARLCGYLPLALRIVAAKLAERPHWTVQRISERLVDEHGKLAELQLGVVNIEANVSLSYEELSAAARTLFLRLSLLGNADFASWVCAPLLDTDLAQAEDALDELVASHLVEVRRTEEGQARFQLHELIRSFTVRRLAAGEPADQQECALGRVLGGYLFLAKHAHRRVYGGDFALLHGTAPAWPLPDGAVNELLSFPMAWFRAERPTLLSVIARCAQAGLHEGCWELATTAVVFFEAASLFDDWERSHQLALSAVRTAGNERGEAALLCSLGELAYARNRVADARVGLERARRTFDALGDVHGRALASSHLGFIDRVQGRGNSAVAGYLSAADDLRRVGDRVAQAHVLCGIAQVFLDWKEWDAAELALDRAVVLCAPAAPQRVRAQIAFLLGEVHLGRGTLELADESFRLVLDEVRARGDQTGESYALCGVGTAALQAGRPDQARVTLEHALRLSRDLGNRLLEGRTLLALMQTAMAEGALVTARKTLSGAVEALEAVGAVTWLARAEQLSARLAGTATAVPGEMAAVALARPPQVERLGDPGGVASFQAWLKTTRKPLRRPLS